MKRRGFIGTILGAAAASLTKFSATGKPKLAQQLVPTELPKKPISPATLFDFGNRDVPRLETSITFKALRESPFLDILNGGEWPGPTIDDVEILSASPPFSPIEATESCGSTEYTTKLGTVRGRGLNLNMRPASLEAFQVDYHDVQGDLVDRIVDAVNTDARAELTMRSGLKAKLVNALDLEKGILSGGFQCIDVPFRNSLEPDMCLTLPCLALLSDWAEHEMLLEPFDTFSGPVVKLIASSEIGDQFLGKVTTPDVVYNRHKIGDEEVEGFKWRKISSGIVYGEDKQPLRFNRLIGKGEHTWPDIIEPKMDGFQFVRGLPEQIDNPAYAVARFEIAYLAFSNSFMKMTPSRWSMSELRPPKQYDHGELEFVLIRDHLENLYGDWGYHIFNLCRAYRPIRPHAVIPIAFARLAKDIDLAREAPRA
jgi:hypothetical protein